jgi:chromosome segregation ATPase
MTPSKYFLLCIASRFGYLRKNVRLGHAANEAHLLKEAETFLGEAIWRKTENIETLSMEYWNLRKLVKDHDRISKEIAQLQGVFIDTHQQKVEGLKSVSGLLQGLAEERKEALAQLNTLTRERDLIVSKAQDIRKIYDGLKIKLDVLRKEGAMLAEIEKTSSRLAEVKRDFDLLKERREEITQELAAANTRIREIEAMSSERKQHGKSQATENFQYIGDANQQISTRQAQLNSHYAQMRALYADIGRHVSLNAAADPACKAAGKEHRGLIDVMAALRRSIQYNFKLAERR